MTRFLDDGLVLYGSTTSPFVRKVRVLLLETGLDFGYETVPPWAGQGAWHLGPLGRVPVLTNGAGVTLYDSRSMTSVLYDEALRDRIADPVTLARHEAVYDGLCEAVIAHVQEHWRGEASRSAFLLARLSDRIRSCFGWIESHPPGNDDLIALFHAMAFEFTTFWLGPDALADYVSARRTLDRVVDRPSFGATTPWLPEGASFPAL